MRPLEMERVNIPENQDGDFDLRVTNNLPSGKEIEYEQKFQ